MFKLSVAFSAATLVSGMAVQDTTTYCDLLKQSCPAGMVPFDCPAAFAGYDTAALLGDDTDVEMNTIGCRLKFLQTVPFNNATDCRYASPSGGGRCGSVLESTCKIAVAACNPTAGPIGTPSYLTETDCMTGLGGGATVATAVSELAFQWGSLQGNLAASDDSLECRLYHAYTGQTVGGSSHCSHWNRTSTQCNKNVVPTKAHYCNTLMHNCGLGAATYGQYNTLADCMASAAAFPSAANTGGLGGDAAHASNNGNTLGCREYHAQAASASPVNHCHHGGPSGGNFCGTYQEAWSSLSNVLCPADDVHVLLASVNSSVANSLVPKGPAGNYATSLDKTGNTQVCRIYHLTVASVDATHCAHGRISGGAACGATNAATTIDHLCNFIGGTCGFGTAAWQHATLASCKTDLGALALGAVMNTGAYVNDTMECRFYHAAVAAQWAPGNLMAADANATDKLHYHCSHVLKTATAGGCGYVAPPTAVSVAPTAAAAPTPKTSSACAVSLLASLIAVAVSVFSF